MTLPQSLLMGVIQGLTEFLPISSTAHLVLAPTFFGFTEPPHAFDVALHIGTLLAVLVYFRRDWTALVRALMDLLRERRVGDDPNRRLGLLVLLGCLPAGIAGLLFEKNVEMLAQPQKHPVSYLVIAGGLIVVGILMAWADRYSRKTRSLKQARTSDAVIVGLAQACALIPGVSRSGSTMTAGLVTGLTREAAARFSFLLSAPITAAPILLDMIKFARGKVAGAEAISFAAFVVGILASGIVGWFCIHFLMEWLRKRSLEWFVYYRIALGIFLIALYFHNR